MVATALQPHGPCSAVRAGTRVDPFCTALHHAKSGAPGACDVPRLPKKRLRLCWWAGCACGSGAAGPATAGAAGIWQGGAGRGAPAGASSCCCCCRCSACRPAGAPGIGKTAGQGRRLIARCTCTRNATGGSAGGRRCRQSSAGGGGCGGCGGGCPPFGHPWQWWGGSRCPRSTGSDAPAGRGAAARYAARTDAAAPLHLAASIARGSSGGRDLTVCQAASACSTDQFPAPVASCLSACLPACLPGQAPVPTRPLHACRRHGVGRAAAS